MHKFSIITETGIKNRDGALYRDYADNKLHEFEMVAMRRNITNDILNISGNCLPYRGNKHNEKILTDIKNLYENGKINNINILIHTAFNFGFMQGGKAVRIKKKQNAKNQF